MIADVAIAWVVIIGAASLLLFVELAKQNRSKRAAERYRHDRDLAEVKRVLERVREDKAKQPVVGTFDE